MAYFESRKMISTRLMFSLVISSKYWSHFGLIKYN